MISNETAARAVVTGSAAPSTTALDQFKAEMIAKGIDPTATLRAYGMKDEAHSEKQEATLDGNSGDGLVDPNKPLMSVLNPVTKHGAYGAADAQKAYENWIKLGLPEDKIRAALAADGFVQVGEDTEPSAGTAFDASPLAPPANGAGYELNYSSRAGKPNVLLGTEKPALHDGAMREQRAQGMAFDREIRTAFSAAGIPKSLGQGLLDALLDGAQHHATLKNDDVKRLHIAEQEALFGKMGGDKDGLVAKAKAVFAKMPKAMRDKLHAAGALSSATGVRLLAQAGELAETRAELGKRK